VSRATGLFPEPSRVAGLCLLLTLWCGAVGAQSLPSGLVYLRDVDPGIEQDIRYAGPENFTGRPLPGYEAGECVLREEAARALAQVRADLAVQGLGLRVYDCYRPVRAVRAMAEWAGNADESARARYFPRVDKRRLIEQGYIAMRSAHSTGLALDLTLVDNHQPAASSFRACGAAAAGSLDMGTGFDCFDPLSHSSAAGIGDEAGRHRALLSTAMQRRGFIGYPREWWHFAFPRDGAATRFDVTIRPRPNQ